MVSLFLRLEWLQRTRSASFDRMLLTGIILALFAVSALGFLALLGATMNTWLQELAGEEPTLRFLNRFLIYFVAFEFIFRYFLQKLPVFELEKFLHLPVRRATIMHYLMARSYLSPLNLVTPLLFLPFAIQHIGPTLGVWPALSWAGGLILISLGQHGLMLWFKQRFEDSWLGLSLVMAISLLAFGGDYYGWFSPGRLFAPLFDGLADQPIALLIPLALAIGGYVLAWRYYLAHASLDLAPREDAPGWADRPIGVFRRFGLDGDMAEIEWKLILRHKKSRTYLTLTFLFLLYGLLMYEDSYFTEDGFKAFLLFPAIIITGMFMMNYGQFLISWNSAHFDFYLMRPGGIAALIRGKFLLFLSFTGVIFLLTLPYGLLHRDLIGIHLAVALFNVGINLHLVSLISLWNPQPMDIQKGGMFNYEGVGCAQFLMVIPVLVLPMGVYALARHFTGPYTGLVILGLIGAAGLALFPALAGWSIRKCLRLKYAIAADFRK